MKIGYRNLKIFAVLYAVLPIAIFFFGYLNIVSAVILTAISIAAVYFFIKNSSHRDGNFMSVTLTKRQLIVLALIAFIWCLMSGQGSFVHQSEDHMWRNAIFRDLITHEWPVTYDDGTSMLSYYIAHWMLPAVMGKLVFTLSGSAFAGYITGNIALLLWSSLGCFVVLVLVTMITNTGKKQHIFFAVALFIFFSGLDIIGILYKKNLNAINNSMHIEWWAKWFQFSSNTTQLYWVYNQVIVPWILTLCIMNEKRLKNIAVLGILAFPYGPFPFVGIFLICLFKALSAFIKAVKTHKVSDFFKDILSAQNIVMLIAIVPIYIFYYTSNAIVSSDTGAGFRMTDSLTKPIAKADLKGLLSFLENYILFMFLELYIYILIIHRRKKLDFVLKCVIISLFIIPLYQMGKSSDFAMRASIPGLLYVCVTFMQTVIKELPEWGEYGSLSSCLSHKRLLSAALIIFMIGSVTPCTEIKREFLKTISTPYSEIIGYSADKESLQNMSKNNFIAKDYQQSVFYKYFCKK